MSIPIASSKHGGSVPLGEWNVAVAVVGEPGFGKSTYLCNRAIELSRVPAYVIVHDVTRSYRGPNVWRHSTPASLLMRLARNPSGVHCLDVPDGSTVLAVAEATAQESRVRAEKNRSNPVPTVVVFDEVCTFKGMSPYNLDKQLSDAYVMRRHRHLGFLWGTQRPQMVHPMLWDLRSELIAFRCQSRRVLQALDEYGVPRDKLTTIQSLPRFHHVNL